MEMGMGMGMAGGVRMGVGRRRSGDGRGRWREVGVDEGGRAFVCKMNFGEGEFGGRGAGKSVYARRCGNWIDGKGEPGTGRYDRVEKGVYCLKGSMHRTRRGND